MSENQFFANKKKWRKKTREEASFLSHEKRFEVAFLQSEFLRDACLVERDFYDDYFRLAPGKENKKSRPYLVFKVQGQGDLFVPLRHKSYINDRMKQWYVLIGEPVQNEHYKKRRQATLELSKSFWVKEEFKGSWEKWIVESWDTLDSLKNGSKIAAHSSEICERVDQLVKSNLLLTRLDLTIDFWGLCGMIEKYRMRIEHIKDAYIQGGFDGDVYYLPDWLDSHNDLIDALDDAYTRYSKAAAIAVRSGRMNQKKASSEEKRVMDEARNYVKLFVDESALKTFMDENGAMQINDTAFVKAHIGLCKKISWMNNISLLIEGQNEINGEKTKIETK